MNKLLGKDDIIERISDKLIDKKIEISGNKYAYKRKYHLKYSKVIIKNVLDAFWDVVADAISDGDSAWIYNYAKIEPKFYKVTKLNANGFKGMNENIIPARYKAKFKMGECLKSAYKQLLEIVFARFDTDEFSIGNTKFSVSKIKDNGSGQVDFVGTVSL